MPVSCSSRGRSQIPWFGPNTTLRPPGRGPCESVSSWPGRTTGIGRHGLALSGSSLLVGTIRVSRQVRGSSGAAHGLVTGLGRYRALHVGAKATVEALVEDFDVRCDDGAGVDRELARHAAVEDSVRVEPLAAGAAPIVVGFTTFPGLVLQCGRWFVASYPRCGCDACDEGETDLARTFESTVAAVAAGHFREELRGGLRPQLTTELWSDRRWSVKQHRAVARRELKRLGPPATLAWRAWPRR